MIGDDHNVATLLVDGFRELIEYDQLAAEAAAEFDELSATALRPGFPGALLVWPRIGKPSVYYAIAANAAEWRRLRPLLIAYVGPTLTSFNGWPETLLTGKIPVERYLDDGHWHTVARLVPGEAPDVQKFVQRSFQRMLTMLQAAPELSENVPQPTSRLLGIFIDCLNGDDYAGAERVLATCRSELRLDALNLLFLRIRLLAHFSDWQGIVDMPQFVSLCHTRKPPLVTATLLEAIYQVKVAFAGPAAETLMTQWKLHARTLTLPLLRLPIPVGASIGALRLYALEALCLEERDGELERAVLARQDVLADLVSVLLSKGRNGIVTVASMASTIPGASVHAAQVALISAERANTSASLADALCMIGQMDEDARSQLFQSTLFKEMFEGLLVDAGGGLPATNWTDWLDRLDDPSFTSAHASLQRIVAESPAAGLADSAEIVTFARTLAAVPETPPAGERMADSIPSLVSWAAADPSYPRAGMVVIYETLLYHLMIGVRRGTEVFESSAVLIRGLLETGTGPANYEALLSDCLVLVGDGMGKRRIYWMFNILEETILNSAPSPQARQDFWFACHERLIQVRAYMSPGQRLAFGRLAGSLGWPVLSVADANDREDLDRLYALQAALKDKRIAIYTLTESAGRQAQQALLALVPSVRISISNDEVGTIALKNMAQSTDIFVMVTASAKHAATGFIQQHRPRDKPLLFANGRGFTSIVRAVEEHILG